MNKKLIRKMLTAAGGGLVYDDRKNIERTNYNNWSKLSFVDKMKRRFNIAKHLFNESSSPIVNSVGAIFGEYDPENPDLNTGIVNAPGRATPQLVLSSVLTINKFKNIFKNYNPYAYRKPKLPEIKISDKIIDDVKNIKINPDDLFTDNFIKYLEEQTGRKIKRIPYKNTENGNIYKEGFSFVDENGKEIAHIAGNLKGKNVWVESSYVDPEFRHKGLGKLMYFDFNDNVYNTYGTTLHSSALLRVGYIDGGGMSSSNRLWKSLTDNKLATTEGSGFDWWNIMADPSKIKTAYRRQGGKMNILEFLKNGSGIHIKEKNKGSFTRWCGGNVTEECIRRGKNSSNPKIRKKATFADNARHFKHKSGGKAFVTGVNILDSNPKAYKYIKKKYKMYLLGGIFKTIGNFLNSEKGQLLGNILINGLNTINTSSKVYQAKELNDKALDKKYRPENFIDIDSLMEKTNLIIALLLSLNPDIHLGPLDKQLIFEHLKNKEMTKVRQYTDMMKNEEKQEFQRNIDAILGNASNNLYSSLLTGMNALTKIGIPSSIASKTTSNNTTNSSLGWNYNWQTNTFNSTPAILYDWQTNTFGKSNPLNISFN